MSELSRKEINTTVLEAFENKYNLESVTLHTLRKSSIAKQSNNPAIKHISYAHQRVWDGFYKANKEADKSNSSYKSLSWMYPNKYLAKLSTVNIILSLFEERYNLSSKLFAETYKAAKPAGVTNFAC